MSQPDQSQRLAVFRCDGGRGIGHGHVIRCLALAQALAAEGWRSIFACTEQTANEVSALASQSVWLVKQDEALDRHFSGHGEQGCDLLVVDHYGLDKVFESTCRRLSRTVLAIDDLGNRAHDADVLLDQTWGREADSYHHLVPSHCGLLLGTGFALLRPQFRQFRARSLARRLKSCSLCRVLISVGGSDNRGLLPLLLQGVSQSGLPLKVDVVAASSASSLDRVWQLLSALPLEAHVHVDVDNVAELMMQADLAIGAAGSGAWERACLGLPALTIAVADNQHETELGLLAAGAARSLGPVENLTATVVAQALAEIAKDTSVLVEMARAAASMCDGLGARRCAIALAPERDRLGRAITLRRVEPGDSAILFDWQTPQTRRHFRNPRVPSQQEHQAWFQSRLANADDLTEIVQCEGRAAGVIRLDRTGAPDQFELSILISPELQGFGIGVAALAAVRRLLPDAGFLAEVLPENEVSHRLFRAAGFDHQQGKYVSPGKNVQSSILHDAHHIN